jgi:N utilization substance protein B
MPEQVELYLDGIEHITEEEKSFLRNRYEQIASHVGEIDEMLNSTARGWKTSRFNSCDLAVLRVAVFEMEFDEMIPDGVAINEAVELAKLYGGDDSPSFINGILGELSRRAK